MGENTRYIHIRHPKTFPRQSYRIQNPSPFPAPFSLLALRSGVSASRPAVPMGAGRSHPRLSSRSCSRSLYPFRAVSRAVLLAVVPVPSSHQLIYPVAFVHLIQCLPYLCSPVLVAYHRPVPLPAAPTSRAGRCLRIPYRRPLPVISAHPMSWDVETCRGMSQDAVSSKQTRSVSLSPFRPRR